MSVSEFAGPSPWEARRPLRPVEPPADLAGMKQMIITRRTSFSRQAEQVLRTSLENPELVALGTAKCLAQRSGVAPATVLRAIRTLGFEGFSGYRVLFRDWLTSRSREIADRA
jgi:DNA-binding MurR/RpiR family transcriptional regulator